MSAECRTQNGDGLGRWSEIATRHFGLYLGMRGSECKRWEAAPLNRDAIHGYVIADPNSVRVWSRRTRRWAESWFNPSVALRHLPFQGRQGTCPAQTN